MSQPHSLMWGDIRLAGDAPIDPDAEFVIETMADGTKLGTAKALIEFVKSLQVDGSLAVMNGHDNAEQVLQLKVSAPPGKPAGPAVAKGAAALAANAAADPIPPLVWVSPLEDAATCVYDIESADPVRDEGNDWDLDEVQREARFFTLSISRHPFARPVNPVVVPALAAPPVSETKTVIDTCDSTAGWTIPAAYGFGTVERTNETINPSPVLSTTGWTGSGASLSRIAASSVTPAMNATRAAEMGMSYLATVTNPSSLTLFNETAVGGAAHAVTPGERIYLRAEIAMRVTAAGGGGAIKSGEAVAFMLSRWNNGTLVGPASTGSFTALTANADANGWVYATLEGYYNVPSGTNRLQIGLFTSGSTSGLRIYSSNFMFERVAAGTTGTRTFISGGLAETATRYYAWKGTAYASASVVVIKPTPTASSGQVVAAANSVPVNLARMLELRRVAALASPGALTYLRISMSPTVAGAFANPTFMRGLGGLSPITPVAVMPGLVTGYVDYYFPAADFDQLSISLPAPGQPTATSAAIAVTEVTHTNMIVSNSTNRQRSRTATILGSAPTQAAIRVYDSSTPTAGMLGNDILVYTTKNAALAPPLRPFLTSGGATADTSMISGGRTTLATPSVFRIPATRLTDGMHGLVGRLNVTTAGTLTWSTRIVDNTGAATIGSGVTDSGSIEVPVTSGYRAINLAAMLLPPVEVEGNQLVEITITGTANMTWDELWLFNLTEGSLTWIRDADNLAWIEVRPPELGKMPSIYGGTGTFGTNPVCIDYKTIGADFGAADQHYAEPGLIQVFTVTSTSLKAQAELWYFPRYLDAVIDEQINAA